MQNRVGIPKPARTFALVVVTILFAIVCDDPADGPVISFGPPVVEPIPSHQALNVSIIPTLIWPSTYTDGQQVRYELLLDTVFPPRSYAVNLYDTVFQSDLLEPERTYYWRVITSGSRRVFQMSPLWSFTTGKNIYPLSVGNRWSYEIASWFENVQPVSLLPSHDDTIRAQVDVEIDGFMEVTNGPGLYRFHSTYSVSNRPSEGYLYYEHRDDGLYLMGVEGVDGGVSPKPARGVTYGFAGRSFDSMQDILAYLECRLPGLIAAGSDHEFPRKCYQFPFRVGDQWTFMDRESGPWRIDRRVVDRRMIEGVLGSFYCYVIRHLFDFTGNGEWDENIEILDYVGPEGLIRRTTRFKDLIIRDWGHGGPGGAGTADFVSDAVLTDIHLENR